MRRLDELHLEFPFAGRRMLRGLLTSEGCKIGRRHVKTLMRRMGIEALYRRPRTTKPEPGHKIYPYLLRGDGDHAAEPGVGDGHHLHPDGARLRLSGRRARLVQPSRAVVAAVDHDGGGILRRRRWRTRWRATASRRSSTPIRARSSRARPSPACSPTTALRSAWTARAPGATTSSLSGCGAASNMRRCICRPTTASARPAVRSAVYLDFYNGRRPHSSLDGTHTRSSLLHSTAIPLGSLTPAETPLIDAENLFRQPGPPQTTLIGTLTGKSGTVRFSNML